MGAFKKELTSSELTIKQKLGMAMTGHIWKENDPRDNEYALELIRNHSLGAVWIDPTHPELEEVMAAVREAADYPILIMCDAEEGIGGHFIGKHNTLGCTGSEELAYIFGKVTAVTARQMGYNVVCNPILDMVKESGVCGSTVRSMGGDKYKVADLAMAEAQGMHDGGVLTVGKHYPGAGKGRKLDSHMAERVCEETAQELLDYALYPYLKLMEKDLLDGIMVGHVRLPKIDPDYPASLSKNVIDIIREQGFDGFAITDALCMMGIVAKFGENAGKALAIAGGIDLALPWYLNKQGYEALCEGYESGIIDDKRLDEAVRRVLVAQHKTLELEKPKFTELTKHDMEEFDRINRDSVYGRVDEGLTLALPRDGRHYFVVLVENTVSVQQGGEVNVDQMLRGWYQPREIMDKIKHLFPNSTVMAIDEFASSGQIRDVLENSVGYDDVVFITFIDGRAYVGRECLTSRIISLIEALQVDQRVSAIVHFGNPFVLEELEHIPRVLIGGPSADIISCALDILAGEYQARGCLTYEVRLK